MAKENSQGERIEALLDAMPLACRLWNRDIEIFYCNEESLRLFNVSSRQELIDRYFELSPVLQPDGRPSVETAINLVNRAFDGERIVVEWTYHTLDGTVLPTEITLIRVPYEGDYAVAGYTRDLREQKKMIEDIKQRDMLLSTGNRAAEILLTIEEIDDIINVGAAITKSMDVVGRAAAVDRVQIWRNEVDGDDLYFAHDYEWLSDYGHECGPVPIGIRFPYSEISQWLEMFLRGEYVNGPVSVFSSEGRDFLQAFNMKSIAIIPLYLQEKFWGFFSFDDCRRERYFSEDVISIMRSVGLMLANAINRSALADAVREAHEHSSMLLDSAPFGMNLWNRDCEVFDCNEESVKLFGLSSKQEYIDRFFELAPEYQPDGMLSSEKAKICVGGAFEKGRVVSEWMHQMPDGSPVPAEAVLVRVPYGDDYIVAGYTRDLREHNKMMSEIKERDRLLEEALNEAQKASHAKSDFLANMSHEMRTPLTAVIGLSGLSLDAGRLAAEDRANIDKVYNSGTTLLNLVNDILDISKIEAGMLELVEIDYDVPSLINDTVTQNVLRISEKPVEFDLDIDGSLFSRLHGDELRVKQIMNNLLSNATKYTAEGLVKLRIRCMRDGDTVRVTIEVSDTGNGIRSEDIDKLFLDYAQLDLESNRKIEGTGLGLPITKSLVELMGGSISVKSDYGKGSVFSVAIDQAFVSGEMISDDTIESLKSFRYSDSRHSRQSQINRIGLPYARVLIVDDNLINLDVAKGLMKPYGMQIDCVDSGYKAVELIRDNNVMYDAVFMDHMMPGMDGIEATQRIRELGTEYSRTVPIIALTANAVTGSEEMFLSKGFNAFLSKPIDVPRLDEALRRWVRDKEKEKAYYSLYSPSENTAPSDPSHLSERRVVSDRRRGVDRRRLILSFGGLDVEKGIERFGGSEETYRDILRSYTQNTPPLLDALEHVSEDSLAQYAVTVHGVKGSSRGIGAEVIGDYAESLEKAAKSGDFDYVRDHNPVFLGTAWELVHNLEGLLAANRGDEHKPSRASPANDVLLKLLDACKTYSMDAAEAAMGEIDAYRYESDDGLVEWLRENVKLTNFKKIVDRISSIIPADCGRSPC